MLDTVFSKRPAISVSLSYRFPFKVWFRALLARPELLVV